MKEGGDIKITKGHVHTCVGEEQAMSVFHPRLFLEKAWDWTDLLHLLLLPLPSFQLLSAPRPPFSLDPIPVHFPSETASLSDTIRQAHTCFTKTPS